MQRVPTIMNVNILPDMGRMIGGWTIDARSLLTRAWRRHPGKVDRSIATRKMTFFASGRSRNELSRAGADDDRAHMGRFGSRDEIHTRMNNTPAAVSVSKV